MRRFVCVCVGLLVALQVAAGALEGLVGYWPLDEGSGNVLDELSGHSRAAVVADQELLWAADDQGTSLRFEQARQQEITLPSSPAWDYAQGQEGSLTLCFRVKLEQPGWVIDHRFGGIPGAWGFMAQGGNLVFSVYLDQPWQDDRKSVNVRLGNVSGEWHHVALVWQRGKRGWLKGYLNGVETDAVTDVPVTAAYVQPITIGGRSGGGFGWSSGCIREFAIFNRALGGDEVAAVAERGIPLSAPLAVSLLTVDKLLYRPEETAAVTVRVRNTSARSQLAEVAVDVVSGLQDRRPVAVRPLDLASGRHVVFTERVPLTGLTYGCEVRAAVRQADRIVSEKREFFQVASNIWAVGIGGAFGSALHTGLGKAGDVPDLARSRYVNTFELFFWSPCDWSRHVAPAKQWWSGQACYHQDEDELTRLIARAHEHGIKVAMYASCNPAGPFAWEMARQRPDWFMDARHKLPSIGPDLVEQIDNWNDPEFRKTHGNPPWVVLHPDLRRLEILDYGIDRIIESVRAYAWDAVRFDGHYTIRGFDAISARNMRRLKERVWQTLPEFQFGYNYGRAPEWRGGVTHEMREAMAGGGLYLQEGIRRFHYTAATYTGWQHYATNELRIAKLIQGLGGHYHCMWEVANHPAPTAYYKFVYGLIAGGHPAVFDGDVPLSPAWGAFMTRWSGLLWQPGLTLAEPAPITVSEPAVQWRELVQEAVLSPTHKRVVIHLVNPPTRDGIVETEFPEPVGAFEVTYRPERGTRIEAARLVSAAELPFDTAVAVADPQGALRVAVPGLRHWTMLAIEVSGAFEPPQQPPRFTELPDDAQIRLASASAVTERIIDPNKDAVMEQGDASAEGAVYETNTGSSGVPADTAADEQAGDGLAQVMSHRKCTSGHSHRFMGKSYLTLLQPGRYAFRYRIRWTGDAPDRFWRAMLYVTVPGQQDGKELTFRTQLANPACWESEAGKVFAAPLAARTKLEPAGPYHYYTVEAEVRFPTYVSAAAIVDTNCDGDHRLYLDHIRIKAVESYSDRKQEAWSAVTKPGDLEGALPDLMAELQAPAAEQAPKGGRDLEPLRTPLGQAPQKVLEVRGVQARPYRVREVTGADIAYDLPADYRTLYAYDALVLANFDCGFTSWHQRRMLYEFVRDGGRLVILGGISALGQGAMQNTYLEELLPVALRGAGEVVRCEPPLPLEAVPGEAAGVIFWRHEVSPRDGSETLARAGAVPVALCSSAGKGHVAVFTGTTLGGGTAEATPFWETPSWERLLQRIVRE